MNNFNYAFFVGAAISSALDQTYEPTEVIVVDDGSSDGSTEVIAEFRAKVKPIFKTNGGQASALNAGFENSRGDVVVFLDADDLMLPSAVERAVRLFDDRVVKVHWQLSEVDGEGRSLGRLHKGKLIEGDYRDRIIRSGPIALSQSPTSGNAWSRSFLEQVMPLPEHDDKHGADGFLKKLCPIFGEIRSIEEPLGCYRVHKGNYGGGASEIFKLRRSLRRYRTYCRLLAEHLRRQGVEVDAATWTGPGSQYQWLRDAVSLYEEIPQLVGEEEVALLVDDGTLGRDFHPDRVLRPFLERDGVYWGSPADDAEALRELVRMRSEGATVVLVAFPAFWWLDRFPGLRRHLEQECRCRSRSRRALLFELSPPMAPTM